MVLFSLTMFALYSRLSPGRKVNIGSEGGSFFAVGSAAKAAGGGLVGWGTDVPAGGAEELGGSVAGQFDATGALRGGATRANFQWMYAPAAIRTTAIRKTQSSLLLIPFE